MDGAITEKDALNGGYMAKGKVAENEKWPENLAIVSEWDIVMSKCCIKS